MTDSVHDASDHIVVAVSGGMDSLLSLALIREQLGRGAAADTPSLLAIHAFFLPPDRESLSRADLMAGQCDRLDLPFVTVDLSQAFEENVIRPFVQSYRKGLTPNPCALCNPRMKFGLLFDAARKHGATRIATGHYVRLRGRGEQARLVRGVDPVKDQSYFLSLTPMETLRRAVFPLGDMKKSEVPGELERRGLTPPAPVESQEICFIPDDDYRRFLRDRAESLPGPGPILYRGGEQIGRHRGLWNYTLGQRKGLGIAWTEPLYVTAKDMSRNALIVDTRSGLDAAGCEAGLANILVPQHLWPDELYCQTRYKQRAGRAKVEVSGDRLHLDFLEHHSLPAPGQVAAVYSPDGEVLAGGIIDRVIRA